MLIEILLLNPIYVCLFWAVVINFTNRREYLAKVFLGTFMLVASVVYISHFFYFTNRIITYYYLDSFYTLAYLSVYPLYHIYVRLLTVDEKLSLKKHWKFIALPVVIFVFTLSGYLFMDKEQGLGFIKSVLVEGGKAIGFHRYMYVLFVIGRVTFLLQTFLYLFLSFNLIKANNTKLRNFYSNMEKRQLNWVHFLNVCFAFTAISSIILATVGRNIFLQNELLLLFPSIVFSIILFIIGLFGNNQRTIFTEIIEKKETLEEGKPSIQMKTKLDDLFVKEKIYKHPDLTIWNVSSVLGTNREHVIKIIQIEYGRNFCEHVNHYRLNHSKMLASNNHNLTDTQIAELSGFNSVNSLYKTFQKKEKVPFEHYRKRMINE